MCWLWGFGMARTLRVTLAKLNESERCKPCGKKTCLICDSVSTATTKVLYLLKCKICGKVLYVGKAKTKFRYRFDNYKSKHRAFRKGNRKVPQKLFHIHYCLDGHSGIEDWDFEQCFEQCKTHTQLKERETFWQQRLLPHRSKWKGGVLKLIQKYLVLVFFVFCLRFQLNRNVVFYFSIYFYYLILPSLYGHFNHFHYHFLKDHRAVFSLIDLNGYEVSMFPLLFFFSLCYTFNVVCSLSHP